MSASNMPSRSSHAGSLDGAQLPPRARACVQHLLQLAKHDLGAELDAVLAAFADELGKAADRARNPALQTGLVRTQATLRGERSAITARFARGLEADLARLGRDQPPLRAAAAMAANEADPESLQLVDDGHMDAALALRSIATRLEARAGMALHLLGQRYGVLAACPAPDAAAMPLGAASLCMHVQDAIAPLGLTPEAHALLFEVFERRMLTHYAPFVQSLNEALAADGILPELTYVPMRVKPAARGARRKSADSAATPASATEDARPPTPRNYGGASARAPAMPFEEDTPYASWPGRASGWRGKQAGQDQAALDALDQLLARRAAVAAAHAKTGGTNAGATAIDTWPLAASPGDGAVAGAGDVGIGDVVAALGALPPEARRVGDATVTPRDLRRVVLTRMQAQRGAPTALPRGADDTFELLDLLYARIRSEMQEGSLAARLLQQLQVPLLQLALQDRGFFVQPSHPARELLNTVAESGARWMDEGDNDPALAAPLQAAVDDVVARAGSDPAAFETNTQRLQQQFELAARKAELSERRHVEAARGKEKLELAKRRAAETLKTLLAGRRPSGFVRTLLDQAWSDVLTLALLREGGDSAQWTALQDTTRAIIASGLPDAPPPDPALSDSVRDALVRVGYHLAEADAIARKLARTETPANATSSTALTAKLKARARLGEPATPRARPTPKLAPRTPEEDARFDQLRALPYGTWIEFTTNQQGDVVRRRLSWYSPITGHALFVNQRGQRVGEFTLDSVARQMARGQARIVTAGHARLVDRAWNATLNALRALGGGGDATGAPAA